MPEATTPLWSSAPLLPLPTEDETVALAQAALDRPLVQWEDAGEEGAPRDFACPPGRYPPRMALEGASIVVWVDITVNARGAVIDATIDEYNGSGYPSIDNAALAAAEACRFTPRPRAAAAHASVSITFTPQRR